MPDYDLKTIPHNHALTDVHNVSTLEVTITYTDDSTETRNLVVYTPPSS